MPLPYQRWTKDELNRARVMRQAGCSHSDIDKALGRPAGATKQRLHIEDYRSGDAVSRTSISEGQLVEREALAAARNQRTLTQEFCGDPPPGYSALHGKTGQQ
jgi:CelD/BcsL family acetyltransferase involved in cellulose biosynthesis